MSGCKVNYQRFVHQDRSTENCLSQKDLMTRSLLEFYKSFIFHVFEKDQPTSDIAQKFTGGCCQVTR